MKKILFLICLSSPAFAERATIQSLSSAYLEGLFRAKPHLATFMGDHRFDGKLPDYSPAALAAREKELVAPAAGRSKQRRDRRGVDGEIDKQILADGIALELLYLREIRTGSGIRGSTTRSPTTIRARSSPAG